MTRPPRSSSPHRFDPAFTLIELLVVIGLIALLIGILLPALGASREASRLSVCGSNARQLQLSNDLYATDFADCYAPGMPDRLANLTRWYGARATQAAAFGSEGGPLSSYLGAGDARESVRACPTFAPMLAVLADAEPTSGGSASFERGCGGYGYNTAFVGALRAKPPSGEWVLVSDLSGMPRSRFVDPVGTAVFSDAALRDSSSPVGVFEYSFLEPRFWPEFPGQRPDPSTHFRHGKGGNAGRLASVAWLDGHVSGQTMNFSQASGFYPGEPREMHIGWFGKADDNSLYDPD
jgi:prepilin-type processing-associated H-X9-DG protein